MSVSGSVWTKYIFRTDEYAAETIVECGSICQVEGVEGCHVFRYEKDTWKCHVGKTDNANTNYLATQSGSHNVYMRIGIGIFLSCSFNIDGMDCLCLSRFYDWRAKGILYEHNLCQWRDCLEKAHLQCPRLCCSTRHAGLLHRVQSYPCRSRMPVLLLQRKYSFSTRHWFFQLFWSFSWLQDQKCYLGKTSTTNGAGNVPSTVVNETIYIMPSKPTKNPTNSPHPNFIDIYSCDAIIGRFFWWHSWHKVHALDDLHHGDKGAHWRSGFLWRTLPSWRVLLCSLWRNRKEMPSWIHWPQPECISDQPGNIHCTSQCSYPERKLLSTAELFWFCHQHVIFLIPWFWSYCMFLLGTCLLYTRTTLVSSMKIIVP